MSTTFVVQSQYFKIPGYLVENKNKDGWGQTGYLTENSIMSLKGGYFAALKLYFVPLEPHEKL